MGSDDEPEPLDWSFQGRSGADLHKAIHPNSNFKRCILEEADLTEANFEGSDFSRAAMRGTNLMKSNFDNCDFRGADLRGIDFRGCRMDGVSLANAKISGCYFPPSIPAEEILLSVSHGTRLRDQAQ